MPRLTHKVPSYRLHKASGQAVVTLNGRDRWPGTPLQPEKVLMASCCLRGLPHYFSAGRTYLAKQIQYLKTEVYQ